MSNVKGAVLANEPISDVGTDAFGDGFLNRDYAQRVVDKVNRYFEVKYTDTNQPEVQEDGDKIVISLPRGAFYEQVGQLCISGTIQDVVFELKRVPVPST